MSLSLDDLRKMRSTEVVFGFECSGNRRPLQGLASNGRWTGVSLRSVLEKAGLKQDAREIVFFGADHGMEDVDFRGQITKVEQHFGRSLPRDRALAPEPILAYAMNGEPLTKHQGSPLRLIIPGWYGVANVKWLSQIHAQEEEFLGKFQARWYRTLRGEMIDGQIEWKESAVTHLQLKSFHRARDEARIRSQRVRRRAARRHAAQSCGSQRRRRSMAGGHPRLRRRKRNTRGSFSTTRGAAPRRVSTRLCRA
jgi:DMSO/TMAO reductase YedYZ molybdopterin-dependent catalytic subunit